METFFSQKKRKRNVKRPVNISIDEMKKSGIEVFANVIVNNTIDIVADTLWKYLKLKTKLLPTSKTDTNPDG